MSATQKFFRYLWAQFGDRAAVPDATPVDGSVGYQNGYGFDYQRAPGDPLVKNIERNKWNQVLYDLTLGVRQYQTLGFPEFIDAADNGGFAYPYAKNACVRWTDGQIYLSLVNANTSTPADLTKWQLALMGAGVGGIQFFPASVPPIGYVKANGALLTRADYPVLWAYAQASGNLAVSDGAWQRGQFSPGDGATTFRVPDARGYHPRAWDDGAGVDAGRVLGSAQSDTYASHSHVFNDAGHSHVFNDAGHTHGVIDGGHAHPLIESGFTGGGTTPLAAQNAASGVGATEAALTGIGIAPATVGANIAPATTGANIAASGGPETRGKNIAWLACIKYL